MVDFGLSDTVIVPPSQLDIAEWVMKACCLQEQIVCNAWMKNGYAWFTDGEEVEDRNGEFILVVTMFFLMMMQTLIQMLTSMSLRVWFDGL